MRAPVAATPPPLRVLGVDPGTSSVGWAVVETRGRSFVRLASGVWRLGRASRPLPERLHDLHRRLGEEIGRHAPAVLALESAFFGRNARSALRLGEARGVVMMSAAQAGVPVAEISPASIKRRIAGAGAASKEQVGRMVRLHLAEPHADFAQSDESDALAVALCALLEGGSTRAACCARGRARALPAGARLQ